MTEDERQDKIAKVAKHIADLGGYLAKSEGLCPSDMPEIMRSATMSVDFVIDQMKDLGII